MSNSDNNTNQPSYPPADEHHANGPDETPESTDGDSHYDTDSSGPPPLLTESESGASYTASMTTDASSDQDLDGFDLGGATIHDVDQDPDGWEAFEARLERATRRPTAPVPDYGLRQGDPSHHRRWILLLACIVELLIHDGTIQPSLNPWGDDL